MQSKLIRTPNPVLQQGISFGLILGGVHLAYGLINNLMNLDATGNNLLNNGFMLALLIVFAGAGLSTARATGSVGSGVLAAVVAALVGSALGAISLLVITFLFIDIIRHNTFMIQDFIRSGMKDMDAFIIEDALGGIFFGSLLSLVLGIALGTLGGWLGTRARITRRAT